MCRHGGTEELDMARDRGRVRGVLWAQRCACALLAALLPAVGTAAEVWHEVERGDGILVETGETGPNLMALRLSFELDASPAAVRAVLLDLEGFPDWAAGLAQWRVLSRSASTADVYARYAAPWPLSDRDYVAHYTWRGAGDSFELEASATGDGRVPEVSGVERLRRLRTLWQVFPRPSGAAVVYTATSPRPAGLPRPLVEWVWRREARRSITRLQGAARAQRPAAIDVSAR